MRKPENTRPEVQVFASKRGGKKRRKKRTHHFQFANKVTVFWNKCCINIHYNLHKLLENSRSCIQLLSELTIQIFFLNHLFGLLNFV